MLLWLEMSYLVISDCQFTHVQLPGSAHWSPNSLVPQYIIEAHWSPISLVPHITGPPSHWSLFSLVTPSSANPNGPPSHWSPISLDPHHLSPNSSVPQLIGPPISTHASPIPLVPPTHWSPISMVPHLIGPLLTPPPPNVPLFIGSPNPNGPSHCSPISLVPQLAPTHHPFHWSSLSLPPSLRLIAPPPPPPISWAVPHRIGPFSPAGPPIHKSPPHCLNSLVPHLTGPPMLPFLPCSHWSPFSLVPQCDPGYTVPIGPPSHWSPNVILVVQFSLVPHLIGPPM